MNTVYLLTGGNLGDRTTNLHAAEQHLYEHCGAVLKKSSLYETAAWGNTDQPAFLNQVIRAETTLAPEEVLRIILDIEHELGRVRYERWGARVIDIDLLYYNALVLDSARLTLPHPRLQDRLFNLIPLAEIAPGFVHPSLKKTSLELLESCTDDGVVSRIS